MQFPSSSKQMVSFLAEQISEHYDEQEATNIAYIVIEYFFGLNRTEVMLDAPFNNFDSEVEEDLESIIKQLNKNRPIQYILGEAHFYGLDFFVNKRTLIPRPETEELVDLVLKENVARNELNVLDIGTGTGCIPICFKIKEKSWKVVATDKDPYTLEVAQDNADSFGVPVKFIVDDILNTKISVPHNKFDIIVSNPPYIPMKDKKSMSKRVLFYEPEMALFVPDDEPLKFYIAIADFAKDSLASDGKLYFEIHENFGTETKDMLESKGFQQVEVIQDMQGKYRIVKASL